MKIKTITIGDHELKIPDYYEETSDLPEGYECPIDGISFETMTGNAYCLFSLYPITPEQTMPTDVKTVANASRESLLDNEGLVEVKIGENDSCAYVVTIRKGLLSDGEIPLGVLYTLWADLYNKEGQALRVQGIFQEAGTTGMRDTVIGSMYRTTVSDKEFWRTWAQDPFKPRYKKGALKNQSELYCFDGMFPEHPLTMCRELTYTLVNDEDLFRRCSKLPKWLADELKTQENEEDDSMANNVSDENAGAFAFIKGMQDAVGKAAGTIIEGAPQVAESALENAKMTGGIVAQGAAQAGSFIADGASNLVTAASDAHRQWQFDRFSPIFSDELNSVDFDMPNLIVITDGDSRKNIEVCEGAIGWLKIENGSEVLYLYENYAPECNINFYPYPECDSIYCLDTLNRNRYINANIFFDVIQQEKMSELRNIAHSLGAVRCYLEAQEAVSSSSESEFSSDASVYKESTEIERVTHLSNSHSRSIMFMQEFEGNDKPIKPELNWFKNNKEIISLIDMRCNGINPIKKYDIKIDSSSFSAMSISHAAKIDAVVKGAKLKSSFSFVNKVNNELKKELIFKVLF